VSSVCLGTMTFGVQNTQEQANELMDYYVKECGGNLLDVAEMYPAPASDPRWFPGKSEEIIGNWLAANPEWRSKVLIATKVMGFSPGSDTIGNRKLTLGNGGSVGENGLPEKGPSRLTRESVLEACDASLKRLQVDYIDLYQIHWPDRYVPIFGSFGYDRSKERPNSVPIAETCAAIKELIDAGKIKYYGLSNESTFGVCEWVRAADAIGCPRPVSIQNQFSLLCRTFESELAEACSPYNFDIGLLPWTPLGGGMLTNKYLADDGKSVRPASEWPVEGRHVKYQRWMSRMQSPRAMAAVNKYAKLAADNGVSLTYLALAWCQSRAYSTSVIIGATTLEQLRENCEPFLEDAAPLSDEVLQAIDEIHLECQNPILSV